MSPVNEEKDRTFEGCYGAKVGYAELLIFLQDAFAANREADELGSDERFATCIWSHSGTGKTSIVKQHCRKPVTWNGKKYDGYKVIDVPLAQFEEMGDLHGMPSRHVLVWKDSGEGSVERWVPEEVIKGYFDDGWKMRHRAGVRTMYAPPDWVPNEPGPTILLLDDWNRASVRIVKGVMQLLQNYGMVSWKLPPGCNIVLTANPDEQDYLVTSLDPAILTRIKSVTLKHDAKEWSVWAQRAKIDPRVISWVLQYPEMMIGRERTNPRTIAEIGRSCRHINDLNSKESIRRFHMQASSLLDEESVSSLTVFMQRDAELVVEPRQILDGEDWIPKHIEKLMTQKEKRVDVLGVICDRLFAYIVDPSTERTPKAIKNFQAFLTMKEVPDDMRHNICLRVFRANEGAASEWLLHNNILTNMILDVL
jgi:MoxR-like ATPase